MEISIAPPPRTPQPSARARRNSTPVRTKRAPAAAPTSASPGQTAPIPKLAQVVARPAHMQLSPCPVCGIPVKKLEKHLRKQHPGARVVGATVQPGAGEQLRKVSVQLPATLVARLLPTKAAKAPSATPHGPPCPECRQRSPSLSAHVLREHGWRTLDGVVTQPGAGRDRMALCSECGVPVLVRKLPAHRAAHAEPRHKKPAAERIQAAVRKARRSSTAQPSASTPADKKKKRGKAKSAAAQRTVPSDQPRAYTWDQERWGSFEQERRERLSDATRGLGYARRESGHWGSTVAFDDYGEESDA